MQGTENRDLNRSIPKKDRVLWSKIHAGKKYSRLNGSGKSMTFYKCCSWGRWGLTKKVGGLYPDLKNHSLLF